MSTLISIFPPAAEAERWLCIYYKERINLEMLEKEIQEKTEKLFSDNTFRGNIIGIDDISSHCQADTSIPQFNLDYFLHKKIRQSAQFVLDDLFDLDIVATSTTNISIEKSQRLFPDIILVSPHTGKFFLVEIKRSDKTARETITELTAYEHELRNHLPFLAGLDVCYIIISTEYSTLLDHSISGLIVWESKKILCLKVSNQAELNLHVYLPSVWSNICGGFLPPDSIHTVTLCLYPRQDCSPKQERLIEQIVSSAMSLIVRDGDRMNSHGFILLWQDTWNLNEDDITWKFTIGFINSYSFIPIASRSNNSEYYETPISKYLIENDRFSSFSPQESGLKYVANKMYKLLSKYFTPSWEGFSSWEIERTPWLLNDDILLNLRHRAIPIKIDYWGILGEYSRDFFLHEDVRKSLIPYMEKYGFDFRHPYIGIPFIDEITGLAPINFGRFNCRSLFRMGFIIASLNTICGTIKQMKGSDLKNLPASFDWFAIELSHALREVAVRYLATDSIKNPPPTLKLSIERPHLTIQSLSNIVQWFHEEFLSEQDVHQLVLNTSLELFPLYDSYLKAGLSNDQIKEFEIKALESSNHFLSVIINIISQDDHAEHYRSIIKKRIIHSYFEGAIADIDLAEIENRLKHIPADQHISKIPTALMDLLDIVFPEVFHELAIPNLKNVNWEYIRSQINLLIEKGNPNVGVYIGSDGSVNIALVNILEASVLRKHNYKTEVIVQFEMASGLPIVIISTWDELITGKLFEEIYSS